MAIIKQAFRGGLWLTFFTAISQSFSWLSTIIVARLLSPEDYGLMEMATILTGYVQLMLEFGLGSAIIQRKDISDKEFSSLFWFIAAWGCVLAGLCFVLAYPTVLIFNEPRVYHITQVVSVLFLLISLAIIPRSILHRDLRFKDVGKTDTAAVIVSVVVMVVIAWLGGGVWTLILGHVTREFVRVILLFALVRWRPRFHARFKEVLPFLNFGFFVTASSSLHYVITKADRFFGGRVLGGTGLGFYTLALQLAVIPTNKIVVLINSVTYPVFSKLQSQKEEFNRFYLRVVNLIALITFPAFMGGLFMAEELILLVLGEKWAPCINPFRILCVAQLFASLSATNQFTHNAQGRPNWVLYFNMVSAPFLVSAFWFASTYKSITVLAYPWVSVYILLQLSFLFITLRKLDISIISYLNWIIHPTIATGLMISFCYGYKTLFFGQAAFLNAHLLAYVLSTIGIAMCSYGAYLFFFQKTLIKSFIGMVKK